MNKTFAQSQIQIKLKHSLAYQISQYLDKFQKYLSDSNPKDQPYPQKYIDENPDDDEVTILIGLIITYNECIDYLNHSFISQINLYNIPTHQVFFYQFCENGSVPRFDCEDF